MAQATITFDNTSGFFPVDFNEVTIQRRIERDGNSRYFLNKAEVRLKDIIDFFAKVRLGTRGLSIINQGSSDLFVRATPQERRMMIEEILGLRQYQLKKHEAERKLKNTRVNVEKVRAMIEEIAPHLRFLKRQTSKWEKLADLEGELKSYEQSYYGNKLKEIRDGRKRFDPEIKRLDGLIRGKEKELEHLKALLEKVEKDQPSQKNQIGEVRKKRDALLQERSAIEREVGKLEVKIEVLNSLAATENLDLRSGELLTLLEEIRESLTNLLNEKNLAAVHQELEALRVKIASVTDTSFKKKNAEMPVRQTRRMAMITKKIVRVFPELFIHHSR